MARLGFSQAFRTSVSLPVVQLSTSGDLLDVLTLRWRGHQPASESSQLDGYSLFLGLLGEIWVFCAT